ncbi:MAG TPA: aspartyl protease family protein [Pyrinomonadaceae bacterium]|nr:aspartyl protease family protein [Pyrinomonadaceae bacterium]
MQYLLNKASGRGVAAVVAAAFVFCLGPALEVTAVSDKGRLRAERALREGDYESAEKIYRELLAKDPRDTQARLGLSSTLLKRRHLQDAYDHAARVVMVDPLSARAHSLLGSAILAGGDFRNSVEEFRTALSINENDAPAVAGLAMVDFYENRLDLAVRGLRRASSLEPNEPDYIFNLGQAAARSERYREAADAYERFLVIAPKTDSDRRARIRGLIDFLRYLGKQAQLYVPGGGTRTTIPFESVDQRPILRVQVNGNKREFRFVLDTGSGMSVISDKTAKVLGLNPVAQGGLARAVGGGGKFQIVYGFLSSLEIGDVKVSNVPVYIRRFYDDAVPVDGYIGLSIISKFLASLDYSDGTFSLVRRTSVDHLDLWQTLYRTAPAQTETVSLVPGSVEVPLRTTSSGFLSGEVMLEGVDKPQNFIIDTGASISVISEKLAAHEAVATHIQPTRLRVYGAAGIAEDVKTLTLPAVMLGTITRRYVNAAILDLEPVNETAGFSQDGILGANFLKSFRVSFDFHRGVIRLDPISKTARADEAKPDQL